MNCRIPAIRGNLVKFGVVGIRFKSACFIFLIWINSINLKTCKVVNAKNNTK